MNSTTNSVPAGRMGRGIGRVTLVILLITVFFYFLQELTRAGILRDFFLTINRIVMGDDIFQALMQLGWGEDPLVMLGGKFTPLILDGQVWRFLSPALLHSSLMHIGFNMYALFIIGSSVESYYGSVRYLALYVLGAFGGSVLSFLLTPAVSIGASGAVFALIGAEAMFVIRNRAVLGDQARALLTNVAFIIMINLFLGVTNPRIDNWGHMGGLLAGAAFGWLGGPLLSWGYTELGYSLTDARTMRESMIAWLVVAASFAVLVYLGYTMILV
jgi:rhomboid protease GluP